MTVPNLTPNGLPATAAPRWTPKKHAKNEASRHDTKVLKPVPPNFFYRRDENAPPTPRQGKTLIGTSSKRKHDAMERGAHSSGRPTSPFTVSVTQQQGKRRCVMGKVDGNLDGREEPLPCTLAARLKRERIPLFMPSPSPEKPRKDESLLGDRRTNHGAERDEQADEMVRELLEGLDDPCVELFDDELEPESTTQTDGKDLESVPCLERSVGESLEMHEWMKVGDDESAKVETFIPASDGKEVKVEPTTKPAQKAQAEFSDAESEYADDFDYDAIDLDGIVAPDAATSAISDGNPTPLLVKPAPSSTYPIPNPPIHNSTSTAPKFEPVPWRRCIVETATTALPVQSTQRFGNQAVKVLLCRVKDSVAASSSQLAPSGGTRRKVRCELKGEWAELVLAAGDVVNIVSPEMTDERLSTTDTSDTLELSFSYQTPDNFLIAHPDILFPMTALAGAVSCRRKPLVQDLVKSSGGWSSKPLLYGNILHELLQETLQTREFSAQSIKACLDALLRKPSFQLDIWSCDLGIEEVRAEVWEKAMQSLVTFGDMWVGPEPKESATIHDSMAKLAITGLHDIEESIWSPKWGMKGKVDASVHATIQAPAAKGKGKPMDLGPTAGPMPFEIKTGRAIGVMEHRAQTMLYTLLMEERYRTPIKSGLLYYTQTDSILQVPAAIGEVRSLLMSRNEMAGYASRKRVRQERAKIARPSQLSQARTQRPTKKEQPESEDGDASEFAHLDDALPTLHIAGETIETGMRATGIALTADVEELPILPPTIDDERECSKCYASDACMLYRRATDNVEPDPQDPIADLFGRKTGHLTPLDLDFFNHWEELISIEEQDIQRFKNQLWTMTAAQREKSGRCFANMKIMKHVDEDGLILAKIHKHSYTFVRADGDSHSSFLNGHIGKNDPISLSIEPDFLAIARGFVLGLTPTEVVIGTNQEINVQSLLERSGRDESTPIAWRIDKDEMLAGTGKMRNNLAQLLYAEDAGGDAKRRELLVHLRPPRFEEACAPNDDEIPDHLNPDQRVAMKRVLTAKDYALILGMPGTGKTTTIAEIILALIKRGKSVLLTSYTHSAVDTILMKLVNSDHRILRLGNADKIHPDVRHLSLDALGTVDSLSQLEDRLMAPQIVATTCLSIDHALFSRRKFDYCIVDEASQITLPTCIGPLRFADTFVLVGDHYQLPPIVKNSEARRGGLDVSLFKLLSDHHTEAVVDLSYQYRMNADIMSLSNTLIYNNRLKCGTEIVANQSLELSEGNSHGCESDSCWISHALQPSAKTIFLNTDKIAAKESRAGDLVFNQVEAVLVYQLTAELLACGIREEQIGVITPYRQQIKILSAMLQDTKAIEVLTADKSQGRDKDCIIISMVRSNDAGSIGELLRDWRRINVSFTRAKKKLIIIGSKSTLSADDCLLSDFFSLIEERKWILDLPRNAPVLHAQKPNTGSPTTAVKTRSSPSKVGGAKLSASLVDSKPFIRDILNDVKQEDLR